MLPQKGIVVMMNLKWNGIKPALVILGLLSANLAFSASRDLYVSSEGTGSIKRYDGVTGAFIGDFVTSGLGGLANPQGISFGPDGNLYVSSISTVGNSSIKRFNGTTGAYMGQFNLGYSFSFAGDLTWKDGILYAAEFNNDPVNGGIHRFDINGNHLGLFAATGGGSDGHLFGSDGAFYAVASQQGVIKKFDGTTGAFVSNFANVGGLLLDLRQGGNGNLFVNVYQPGQVVQVNGTTGANMGAFVSGLATSQGQEIALDGSLLVGAYGGNVINRYNPNTGAFISAFTLGGGLVRPNNFVYSPEAVPEPATLTIAGLSLLALLRKKRSNK